MVTSKNGNIQQMTLHFSYILSIFIDHVCFADHEHVFLGEYLQILHFYIYNTMLHFSAYYDIVYCSWKDLFAIYMHILHVCSTWKTRDGRKCVKNFGVLGVSGLNKQGQNARRGFSHGIPHDNDMQVKQDGNLQKRQYTQTILHFFIFCHFF